MVSFDSGEDVANPGAWCRIPAMRFWSSSIAAVTSCVPLLVDAPDMAALVCVSCLTRSWARADRRPSISIDRAVSSISCLRARRSASDVLSAFDFAREKDFHAAIAELPAAIAEQMAVNAAVVTVAPIGSRLQNGYLYGDQSHPIAFYVSDRYRRIPRVY